MKLFNLSPYIFWRMSDGVFKLLLDSGSDINSVDKYRNTPLMYAMRRDQSEKFELLLDYGADINIRSSFNSNILHDAISLEKIEYIEMTLNHEKNDERRKFALDSVDLYKRTPLSYACTRSDIKTIKLLIDYGSNMLHLDENGNTILMCVFLNSRISNHSDVVKLILSNADEHQRKVLIDHVNLFGDNAKSMIEDGKLTNALRKNPKDRKEILKLLGS